MHPRCILCLRAVNCVRLSRVTSINTYIDARARDATAGRRKRPARGERTEEERDAESEMERPFIIIQPARLTSINIYRQPHARLLCERDARTRRINIIVDADTRRATAARPRRRICTEIYGTRGAFQERARDFPRDDSAEKRLMLNFANRASFCTPLFDNSVP